MRATSRPTAARTGSEVPPLDNNNTNSPAFVLCVPGPDVRAAVSVHGSIENRAYIHTYQVSVSSIVVY